MTLFTLLLQCLWKEQRKTLLISHHPKLDELVIGDQYYFVESIIVVARCIARAQVINQNAILFVIEYYITLLNIEVTL